MSGFAYQPPL
jgi:hypothetical protein